MGIINLLLFYLNCFFKVVEAKYRVSGYIRLPESRAGGQGPCLRSLDHLGRSSEDKETKSEKKENWD